MKRIILSVLAAGTAALTLTASPARADEHVVRPVAQQAQWGGDGYQRGDDRGYGQRGEYRQREEQQREYRQREQFRRANQWRELQREREMFYARWHGNRWERARFERNYQRRCEELRRG